MNGKEVTITLAALRNFCFQALFKAGLPEDDANILTDILVAADLRGVDTHGVNLLPRYVRGFMTGNLNKEPHLKIFKDSPAITLLDGDNGIGQVVCKRAMDIAIKKAADNGVAIISIRNSNHFGAAAYYPMMAADHKMIGYITTNAPAIMPAWGGRTAVMGNNPFCYAIPTEKGFPIVLDMACSATARNRIRLFAESGKKIPLGWAINQAGQPIDDPLEALKSGLILPVGGHKGYGLAVVNEVLAGALSGSKMTLEISRGLVLDPGGKVMDSWGIGHLIIVLNIDYFIGYEEFSRRVNKLIDEIRGSELIAGTEKIYLPGEIEHETKLHRMKQGIPFTTQVVKRLNELASEIGIEPLLIS